MKNGWQSTTLGDVLEVLRNGVNCKQNKSGNGDRISRIESISDASFDLGKVGFAELSERDRERYQLRKGDILFSHINSAIHVGKTAVFESEEPVYHGVNLLLMRPKDTVLPAFLEHALKYLFASGYWRGVCKQSVNQASVNQQDISRVEFRYPKAIPEQRRLVALLDEAFAGIATAQAHAEKNHQNARALFESHLNAVFTQRGDGWVEKRLGDVFEIGSSKRILETEWTSAGIPFYGGKEIVKLAKDGSVISNAYISEEKYQDYASRYGMPRQDDVLITARGTIGVGYVVQANDKFYYKDGNIISMRGKTPTNPHFMLYAFRSNVMANQLGELSGTTVRHLPIEKAKSLVLRMPGFAAQNSVVESIREIEAETQRLARLYERKHAALEALKKSLLHQAFSGEL